MMNRLNLGFYSRTVKTLITKHEQMLNHTQEQNSLFLAEAQTCWITHENEPHLFSHVT